MVLVSNIKI